MSCPVSTLHPLLLQYFPAGKYGTRCWRISQETLWRANCWHWAGGQRGLGFSELPFFFDICVYHPTDSLSIGLISRPAFRGQLLASMLYVFIMRNVWVTNSFLLYESGRIVMEFCSNVTWSVKFHLHCYFIVQVLCWESTRSFYMSILSERCWLCNVSVLNFLKNKQPWMLIPVSACRHRLVHICY